MSNNTLIICIPLILEPAQRNAFGRCRGEHRWELLLAHRQPDPRFIFAACICGARRIEPRP